MGKLPENSVKVIIDTSVWIDFFHGTLSPQEKDTFVALLEAEEVVITDIIKHELLIGTNSSSEYTSLNNDLSAIEEITIQPSIKEEFNYFGFELRKKGLLGKYTDSTIAFLSKKHKFPVWSFDKYFEKVEQKGIISIFQSK